MGRSLWLYIFYNNRKLILIDKVPIESKKLKGLDSLLSIAQMPKGIPVGTLAIGKDGAINASLLAASIIGINDLGVKKKLDQWRSSQSKAVKKKPK